MWDVPGRKLHAWNELSQLITAVSFSSDGALAIAGTFAGQCIFFDTADFKYNRAISAKSSRGKNAKGRKVTNLQTLQSLEAGQDKVLVTSNDSRLRLYNLADNSLDAKYRCVCHIRLFVLL